MTLIRIILLALLVYFVVRLLGAKKNKTPRVKRGKAKSEPSPFNQADIEDVSYTELPPEDEEKTTEND